MATQPIIDMTNWKMVTPEAKVWINSTLELITDEKNIYEVLLAITKKSSELMASGSTFDKQVLFVSAAIILEGFHTLLTSSKEGQEARAEILESLLPKKLDS